MTVGSQVSEWPDELTPEPQTSTSHCNDDYGLGQLTMKWRGRCFVWISSSNRAALRREVVRYLVFEAIEMVLQAAHVCQQNVRKALRR